MGGSLPVGKKRYFLSLNEKNMTFLQDWHKKKNIPKSNVSVIFDDLLSGVCGMLKKWDEREANGEEIKMSDIFKTTAKAIEDLQKAEEK